MDQPLDGVVVVDLTRALAGPTCTALLGDLGAEVIKVESLPAGDGARSWPPFDTDGGESLYFASTNRNKKSVVINLRNEDGKGLLHRLLAGADVLVENFRPGVLNAMGLAPDLLRERYPRLVIASISGFGPTGPERSAPGLDQIAQGMSGLMSLTGAGDQTPMRVGVPIVDSMTGIMAAYAVAAALAGRATTGQGTHVQTSLLETAISVLSFQAQRYLSTGQVPDSAGNNHPVLTPYGAFQAADAPINIAVGSEFMWTRLAAVLGEPALATDPRFADPQSRLAHRDELTVEIERLLAAHPSAEWIRAIRDAGIPCGPIHTLDKVFADPQVQALGMVTGGGRMPLVRGPVWADGQPSPVHTDPPRLGQDTASILAGLGITDRQLADLAAAGVIPPDTTTEADRAAGTGETHGPGQDERRTA